MSYEASEAVRTYSKSKRGARNVMFALAEVAARDGTVWLPIGPETFEDSICWGAKLGERQVVRAIQTLETIDELEVRTWQDGQALKNIYRLLVGSIRVKPVNYDRPELASLSLIDLFWTPEELELPRHERPRQRVLRGPSKGIAQPPRPTDTLSVGSGGDELTFEASEQLTSAPEPADFSDGDQLTGPSVPFKPSLKPAPGTGPAAEPISSDVVASRSRRLEQIRGLETAAASESEPVSLERAVAHLAKLEGWDTGSLAVVMPLLNQLPELVFVETLRKTLSRHADNPPGLLVFLLRTAVGDWRKSQNEARLATWDEFFGESGYERIKREDPERYVLAWATPSLEAVRPLPPALVVEHVLEYVFEHTDDQAERDRLLEIFITATDRIPSVRAVNDWILGAIDRKHRPLDEVLATVDAFCQAATDEERTELRNFATEIHANVVADQRRRGQAA